MTTFAPDAEREFALFQEQARQENKRERNQMLDWLTNHLACGGSVVEHYQEHNAVNWTIKGTCRIINGRPLPNGYRATDAHAPDAKPDLLAAKLLRRAMRWGVTLSYAKA